MEQKQREEAIKDVKAKLLVALKEQRLSAKNLQDSVSRQVAAAEANLISLSQSIRVRVTAAEEKNTRVVANTHTEIDKLTAQTTGILTTMARAKDLLACQETIARMEAEAKRSRMRQGPPPPPPAGRGSSSNPECEADVERHDREIRQLRILINGGEQRSKEEDMLHRALLTRLQERLQRAQARAQKDEEAIHSLESDGNTLRQRLDVLDRRADEERENGETQREQLELLETRTGEGEEKRGVLEERAGEQEGILKGFADNMTEASDQMSAMTTTIAALSTSSAALQQASEDYYAVEQELRKDVANLEDRATTTETVLRPRVAALELKLSESSADHEEQLTTHQSQLGAISEKLDTVAEIGETTVSSLEEVSKLASVTDAGFRDEIAATADKVASLTEQQEVMEASLRDTEERLAPISELTEQLAQVKESSGEIKQALIKESETRLEGLELLRTELQTVS